MHMADNHALEPIGWLEHGKAGIPFAAEFHFIAVYIVLTENW